MQHIEKIIYINLDRRKDRRRQIEEEFTKMDIPKDKIKRFSAINNIQHPHCGCAASHLEALKLARKHNYENVLIMEDDFTFLVSKQEFNKLLSKLFNSNIAYDVVMLSYNFNNKEQLSFNSFLGKCIDVQTASGYLVNKRFYDTLISNLEDGGRKLTKHPNLHWLYMNDQYWKRLQSASEWFYFLERIGKQRTSYSDLHGTVVEPRC